MNSTIISAILSSRWFHAAVIIIASAAADKLLNRKILKYVSRQAQNRSEENAARYKTLFSVLSKFITVVISILVFIWLLQILFGVNPTSLIAATGIAGAALGLGAQSLVKDSINGFFILMEDQFTVGDIVTLEGFQGRIVSVSLRMTCAEGFNGDKMYIPNGSISKVVNHSKENRNVFITVPLSYDADIDEAIAQLEEIVGGISLDFITGKPQVLGVDAIDSSSVNVLIKLPCLPAEQYSCKREALRIIRSEMAKRGMEIPYTHITIERG